MELLNYLQSFFTENRKTKFEEVLSYRTKHLTVVLENIIDNHNSSAVIRSAECFGIQDIHQIDFGSKLKPAKNISRGSYNWMDIHIHKASENNSIDCIQKLKGEGYKIIATTPHIKKQSVSELDLTQKVAIFFGQEHDGLSKQVIDSADEFLIIPMYGFTESLNISVACAVTIYEAMRQAIVYDLQISLENRITHIAKEYGTFEKQLLADCTKKLEKKMGNLRMQQALDFLYNNELNAWIFMLLEYYDKAYLHSKEKRNTESIIDVDVNSSNFQEIAKMLLAI
jgi:tRNA (guanosine-2'-O-)-methyltransferase